MAESGETMRKIVVAGGCFWGVEEYYRRLKGIEATRVGYAQGITENPSYQDVCSGFTKHAEVCELTYDEAVIPLTKILEHLFRITDPTSLNKQGHDIGTQYRVGVFYKEPADEAVIRAYIAFRQAEYKNPIVLEVQETGIFYDAESYHQKYLIKNPGGYCHVNMRLIKKEEMKDKI
jgi:peptide-methionine (S)-S-oxide reductase